MDTETSKVHHICPICDLKLECSLKTHLLSHSKETLVSTLLQLKNEPGESACLDSAVLNVLSEGSGSSLNIGRSAYNPAINQQTRHNDNAIQDVSNFVHNNASASSTRKNVFYTTEHELCPLLDFKVQNTDGSNVTHSSHSNSNYGISVQNASEGLANRPIHRNMVNENECVNLTAELNSGTYTVLQTMDISQGCRDNDYGDELTLCVVADASPSLPDERSLAGNIFPDVCKLPSSTIRCIIDEGANSSAASAAKDERLAVLDGRFIPVFASVKEHYSSSKNSSHFQLPKNDTPAASFNRTISIKSDHSNPEIDLMTDEEIPPKGEISEFEESSTSFVSEDSSSKHFSSIFEIIQQRRSSITIEPQKQRVADVSLVNLKCADILVPPPRFFLNPLNNESVKSGGAHFEDIPDANTSPATGTVLQTKKFFCLYCDFTSPSRTSLMCHARSEHPDQSSNPDHFECTTCGKTFRSRASLRKHLLVHRQKLFVCTVCSKGFPSKYKLMEHLRVHTGNYPYKCKICEKAYRTPSLLSTHEKRAHRDPSSAAARLAPKKIELMCGICHRIMHSKRNLDSHLLLHQQKPQKCCYCSETFPRPSVLVRHIRASHDPTHTSLKTKECSVCAKLLHPNSLKSHLLIHQKEKPHKCIVCHKSFRTLGNLSNHSWSHTSLERPFKCELCPKSYIFLKNLQNHAIVHKKKTLHFVCNDCGMKFTNKCNLKRHAEEHRSEKKFACLFCGKKFFRHYYLNEHIRIHDGTRPYTCTICGKASSTKSNHVAHLKIHDSRESGNLEG